MGQGVELSNNSTESATLPSPLAGVLAPGQRVVLNTTAAILATFGISPSGSSTLAVLDLGATYTGPYDTTGYQGSLNADGSVTGHGTLPLFGDGSDGNVVFDGTSTVLGLAPSTGVYTLTRNIYPKQATVSGAGTRVKGAAFEVICSESLLVGAGAQLDADGNAGALAVAGAAITAQVLGGSFSGGAGGNGGAGANGTNATTSGGGAGGNGGAGTGGHSGGTGGTLTAPTAAQGGLPRVATTALLGQVIGNGGLTLVKGGAGGAGGGDDATPNAGGGGGGGGGVLVIAAPIITIQGRISARGGAGAAGTAGNAGGGGGGGGGCLVIVARAVTNSGTLDAAGGAGGAASGTGTAGSAGSAGNVIQVLG